MKHGIAAEELMRQLEADPEFVAAREQKERERQAREAEYRRIEEPLVRDLRAGGLEVDSAWDLVNTSAPYPNALPILLDHLQRSYPDAIKEGIARALAVREAKFAWRVLVGAFRRESGPRAKDGLAVAIAATADKAVLDELIELAKDSTLGPSRLLLLRALARSRAPQARAALMDLEGDPDLEKEIKVILRRLERRRGHR